MKEKQKQICDTVLEMIASGMPEAEITVAEVARRSCIGKGTVYEYFKNKNDIFLVTAQYFAQETLSGMEACYRGESFPKKFRELLHCARAWMGRCRSLFFFLFLGRHIVPPGVGANPEGCPTEHLSRGIRRDLVELMMKFLSLGRKEGLLREGLELYEVIFACSSVFSIFNVADTGNEELLQKKFTETELEEVAYTIFLRILG